MKKKCSLLLLMILSNALTCLSAIADPINIDEFVEQFVDQNQRKKSSVFNSLSIDLLSRQVDDIINRIQEEIKNIRIVKHDLNHITEEENSLYSISEKYNLSAPELISLFETGITVLSSHQNTATPSFISIKLKDSQGEFYSAISPVSIQKSTISEKKEIQTFFLIRELLIKLNDVGQIIWSDFPGISSFDEEDDLIKKWANSLKEQSPLPIHSLRNSLIDYFINDPRMKIFSSHFSFPYSPQSNFMASSNQKHWWWIYLYPEIQNKKGKGIDLEEMAYWSSTEAYGHYTELSQKGLYETFNAGLSFSTLMGHQATNGMTMGISLGAQRDLTYLGKNSCFDPMTEKRCRHKIEIEDKKGIENDIDLIIKDRDPHLSRVNLFKNKSTFIQRKIFRTYIHLDEEIGEENITGEISSAQLKKIIPYAQEKEVPTFDNPENFSPGEELIVIKKMSMSGQFIMGVNGPISPFSTSFGHSQKIEGLFEIAARKFPNNIIELTISPQVIMKIDHFKKFSRIIQGSKNSTIHFARKQSFIFDLNKYEARLAYFNLINEGKLPYGVNLDLAINKKGPEYVLGIIQSDNEQLAPKGIGRTYLEQTEVTSTAFHFALRIPFFPRLHIPRRNIPKVKTWNSFNLDFILSHSKSIATNGLMATTKQSQDSDMMEDKTFSGTYHRKVSAILKRVYSRDNDVNIWTFDQLLLQGVLSDTVITGDEQNEMVSILNGQFSADIDNFKYQGSHWPRSVLFERKITRLEVRKLLSPESYERIPYAVQRANIGFESGLLNKLKTFGIAITGPQGRFAKILNKTGFSLPFLPLTNETVYALLENLRSDKDVDKQAKRLQIFVKLYGIRGMALIHQILDGDPKNLVIKTRSNYFDVVNEARKFVGMYTEYTQDGLKNKITPKTSKRKIRKFYFQARLLLRAIHLKLRQLHDDQFLIDEKSRLYKMLNDREEYEKLIATSARETKESRLNALLAAQKSVLKTIDFKKYYPREERVAIYQKVRKGIFTFKRRYLFKDPEEIKNPGRQQITGLANKLNFFKKIKKNKKSPLLLPKELKNKFGLKISKIDLLDIKERMEVYTYQYPDFAIRADLTAKELIAPYSSFYHLLDDTKKEISLLENDKNMKEINYFWYNKRLKMLLSIKDQLEKKVSVNEFSNEEIIALHNNLSFKEVLFQKIKTGPRKLKALKNLKKQLKTTLVQRKNEQKEDEIKELESRLEDI